MRYDISKPIAPKMQNWKRVKNASNYSSYRPTGLADAQKADEMAHLAHHSSHLLSEHMNFKSLK